MRRKIKPRDKNEIESIVIKIYLWNNANGKKLPKKTCVDRGTIYLPTNSKHNIRGGDRKILFKGNLEKQFYKLLKQQGIDIIKKGHEKEYFDIVEKQKNMIQ